MTFEDWVNKYCPCLSGSWRQPAQEAWDHQQQRIDAHNERMLKECEEGVLGCPEGPGSSVQCEHCPRRYMIED